MPPFSSTVNRHLPLTANFKPFKRQTLAPPAKLHAYRARLQPVLMAHGRRCHVRQIVRRALPCPLSDPTASSSRVQALTTLPQSSLPQEFKLTSGITAPLSVAPLSPSPQSTTLLLEIADKIPPWGVTLVATQIAHRPFQYRSSLPHRLPRPLNLQ